MNDATQERPRLRPSIDATPIDQNGRRMVVLYDAAGLAESNLGLTPGAFAIVMLMNGENTLDDIRNGFAKQFGQELPHIQLVELLNQLDRAGMLDSSLFEARYERMVSAYRRSPARVSASIDEAADPDELAAALDEMVDAGKPVVDGERVRGLIAPHLDYDRGHPCYAEAYAQVRDQEGIERFVILGTNHFGRSTTPVWTTKDFETPLGRTLTDRGFIEALGARCGADLGGNELDHLREHSVELQVTILQAMFGAERFRIVPILCPDACGESGTRPVDGNGPNLDAVADALAAVLAGAEGRTCVIAGADLSHVGRRFGDDCDLDDEFMKTVEASDRALLDRIAAGDASGAMQGLRETENVYRVCSAGCLYVALRALRGSVVRVLRYHQAVTKDEHTAVTCAAAAILSPEAG